MFTIYAIKSIKHKFIYVGITENLENRLKRHNSGFNHSTKAYAPYFLFYTETAENGIIARQREIYLKSSSGKRFLNKILLEYDTNNKT